MTTHPIPNAALDDRLGFIGTSGSGKTYNAGGAVERLLQKKARVVVIDPLGVWWGLRLDADGKRPSPFDVAIFGGPRGDLPLTEHAGALIGETAAMMRESCIIDLRELGSKASERRFMTAFLETIYRKAGGEPFHLVVDEADLFAPQKPQGGDETLLGHMENIVRRGRVKGFIPWLISQRPAVLNKNVLSQVDGLIAFKLTATQDRDALDAWIEGQADKVQGREIKDQLPAMQIGQGIVWLPAHGILKTAQFPPKVTFDSSRTPKRGERATQAKALTPLNLGALKERLAEIEAATKANDPKALRVENARLNAEIVKLKATPPAPDKDILKAAEEKGFEQAKKKLTRAMERELHKRLKDTLVMLATDVAKWGEQVAGELEAVNKCIKEAELEAITFVPSTTAAPAPTTTPPKSSTLPKRAPQLKAVASEGASEAALSNPQLQLLQSLAWWRAMGHPQPSRVQVASICGWRITSGHLKNISGSLRSKGLIDYPSDGTMALTEAGQAAAPEPSTDASLVDAVRAILNGPQRQVFETLLAAKSSMTRDEVAQRCGWAPTSGHVKNVLGSMRSLEVIDYPSQGTVALQAWVQDVRLAA